MVWVLGFNMKEIYDKFLSLWIQQCWASGAEDLGSEVRLRGGGIGVEVGPS